MTKDSTNGFLYYGESDINLTPIISVITPYAICTIAASISEKIVQCPSFQLIQGVKIIIKFQNGNTGPASLN